MTDSILAESIKNVLGGLITSLESESLESYEAVASVPIVQEATEKVRQGDLEGFYYSFICPLSVMVDGLLAQELPQSPEAQFLFKHSQFVERHFENLIKKYEGSACCADKSRTILESLLRFLKTGEEISFDYTQKYTYHLPELVFKTHGEIVEFFSALHQLYYGKTTPLLEATQRIYSRVNALNKASDLEPTAPTTPVGQ
jgi:hypothetical protein